MDSYGPPPDLCAAGSRAAAVLPRATAMGRGGDGRCSGGVAATVTSRCATTWRERQKGRGRRGRERGWGRKGRVPWARHPRGKPSPCPPPPGKTEREIEDADGGGGSIDCPCVL